MIDIRERYLEDDEAAWVYEHFPQVRKSPDDYCPTCDKKGVYKWKGQLIACDCVQQLQLLKHYLVAGIGATYHRLSWDDLGSDDLVDKVADYGTNHEFMRRGIGLFLVGDVGVGKTMVGTLCLKDFVKAGGYSCFSTTFAMMIDMYASSWRDQEDRKRFNNKIIESDVLLLDDIGKEKKLSVDLPVATLDLVLRQRVQHGRSTIVTSNITDPNELKRYGLPVLSLLREKSISIKVEGGDYREQAQQREIAEIRAGETRPIQ